MKAFKRDTFSPGDNIITQGERTSEMYFLVEGSAEVIFQPTNQSFRTMTNGSHFGEISFFLNTPRCASVAAKTYTEVLLLRRKSLFKLGKIMPEAGETTDNIARLCEGGSLKALHVS